MADKSIFNLSQGIPSYEDEDLAVMDPTLAGLEDEDIDLLNDDTFGSGAVDEDWEEAHRKLAGLDISLKGKQTTAVDDDLDAEEEILEKNLTKLVEEDYCEPKKLYGSSGYKDIPVPTNISSAWNGSPLSSPTSSDSLHDLIHPSTNIWASPEHLPNRTGSEPKTTKPPPGFAPRDTPHRRPFSPAFEDDAIVTAVPKTEPLLPPSSFAKKPPGNAIRLEDLEKKLGEEKPRQQFKQTPDSKHQFMGGRPHPRLPNAMMMTPQKYPSIPNTPHNTPLHTPQHTPHHMYHGQNTPRPGMMYPRTPIMVPNRQMYNKMPFAAGTPHQYQRFPMGHMHSDPAHLLRGHHDVRSPRPRFSTPQGYPPNNYMRQHDNRHHDNNYHRGDSHQQSDLERKIHSILNDDSVNNMDPYAGLMTRREKEWIIKIQLLQLTSTNPDMDDFYFQTYIRRKRARERAKQGEGVENLSTRGGQPAKMTLPDFERQEREYKPLAFKDTLGKLSASHVAHPREMVQVPQIHKESDQEKQGSATKETRRRRQMLSTIEKAFDLVLELDDIDNQQMHASQEERSNLVGKKQANLSKLAVLLKLNSDQDTSSRSEFLCQLMSHRKGKVLVSRLLQVFDKTEGEHLLVSICQHIVNVIKKDHQDEVLPLLIGPLSRVIEVTSMEIALQSFENIVKGNHESLSFVLANQFGISILCCLLKNATTLKMEAHNNDNSKQSWDNLISQVTKQFNDVPVKLLAKNLTGVTPLVTVLASCASPSDMNNLQQHYRLALSAREEMSS